ncbi:MAG: LPS-assembly protein LptD, partial [Candidatus Electrothrix sp. AR4]|nr:LPS-assembly protein LptD [Candidatus Electrothrix sp. AR4]
APESKGTLMGNFLYDDLSDINNPDNAAYYTDGGYTHTNQERYWIRGKADQKFGEWTTRLDFDLVSDRDYLNEFHTGMTDFHVSDKRFYEQFGRGLQDRNLFERENKLTTLRSWSNGTSLEATLKGIDDLLEEERNGAPAPLWKFPEIKYSGLMPLYDTELNVSWNTDYVYYKRDEGVAAQRLDLYPRLTMAVPMLSEYLETTMGIGVRETMYAIEDNGDEAWRDNDSANRFLADFGGEIATTLRKDFALNGKNVSAWSHTLRPFVQYTYITDADQEDYPKFDGVDWMGDKNSITYGMNNFFYVSGMKNNVEFERDYGYIKLQQSYNLHSDATDTPFAPVEFRLAWNPIETLLFKYATDIDVYDDGFKRHTIESDYWNSRGDLFSLDYLFHASENENVDDTSSVRLAAQINLAYNFALGYSLEQSLEDSVTVTERINVIYSPSCWSLELAADVTPNNEQVTIMFKLANIGTPFGMDLMGSGGE